MKHGNLTISEGKLPFWRIGLTVLFFGISSYCIIDLFSSGANFFDSLMNGWEFGALGVASGTTRSMTISPSEHKIYSYYHFGPIGKTIVSDAPLMEYISVFYTEKKYQVNLWYKGNKHYKMCVFDTKEDAFDFAYAAARRLNIDILDATEKGNSKWIELAES